MKTTGAVLIVLIVVAGMLVSLGAMSGYLNFNIKFGLEDNDVSATQNSEPPNIMLLTTDNNEPDTATQIQVPPPKLIFRNQPPFKTILWKPEFVELPPMEYAGVNWGDLIYDPLEMIEDPNPPKTIPIPEPITIPFPGWETVPLPPIIICDPATETSSE